MDDEKFLSKIQAAFSEQNYDRITRAYYFAKRAHEGQKRKSGDDYIVHPIAVADILIDLGLDTDTVIAALLHDTLPSPKRSSIRNSDTPSSCSSRA